MAEQAVASLLAVGVILLAINAAVRRLMRGQPLPYREQKRNTERIALTRSRFRSALSIDRSTRPVSARATRGGSEGAGAGSGGVAIGLTGVHDANGAAVEESVTVRAHSTLLRSSRC